MGYVIHIELSHKTNVCNVEAYEVIVLLHSLT